MIRPDGPRERRRGEGSIYYLPKLRTWQASYVMADGRRKTMQNRDWREVEARLDAAIKLSKRPRSRDRLFAHTRAARATAWVAFILEEANREEWTDEYTARVVVAQLSVRRVRAGIFGPCDYCGTWIAATIDHVVPRSQGGGNERANLVSACWSCNSSKGDRLSVWHAA